MGLASKIEELLEGKHGGLATSPPQSPLLGVTFHGATHEDTPLTGAARREWLADRGGDVVNGEGESPSPLEKQLRFVRHCLERPEGAPQGVGEARGSGSSGCASGIGETVSGSNSGTSNQSLVSREYSSKNDVRPGKGLFHMERYLGYAHIAGDDRVSHGTVLLRDAVEFW